MVYCYSRGYWGGMSFEVRVLWKGEVCVKGCEI